MKYIKFIIFAGLSNFAISSTMTKVNLSNSNYACNGKKITNDVTVSWLIKNCKHVATKEDAHVIGGSSFSVGNSRLPDNDDSNDFDAEAPDTIILQRVVFITDNHVKMKCYFINGKLDSCKIPLIPSSSLL